MENDIQKYILTAVKIGILLILFTPLALGPFGLSFSEYPKTIYLRVITELALILWLVAILISKTGSVKLYPKITPLAISISVFLSVIIVSSVFGFNFARSLWGGLESGGGLITYVHYIIFFFLASAAFKTEKDWLFLFRGIGIVAFLNILAAFLQRLGIAGFYGVGVEAGRVSGTLSNPVYLGFFMVITFFAALYLVYQERSQSAKIIWSALAFLCLIAIVMSGTRAALFGMLLSIGLLAVFYLLFFLRNRDQLRKRIIFSLLLISILLLLLFWLAPKDLFSGGLGARFMSVLDPAAIEGRFPGWETAVRAWRDKPILGWGWESFNYLYYKYFDAHFLKHIGAYYVFNDAHNTFLNLMAETGLAGLLSYLSIWIAAVFALWRGRKKMGEMPTFILITLFAAYTLQSIFAFDTVSTYVVIFVILAFVNNNYFTGYGSSPLKPLSLFLKPLIFILLIVTFSALYFVNIKPALASYSFVQGFFAEQSSQRGGFAGSLQEYERGMGMNTPYTKELVLMTASREIFALENGFGKPFQKEIFESLVKLKPVLKEAMDQPDLRYLNFHEEVARIDEWLYFATQNEDFLKEGREALQKGLAFNSQWMQFYYLLGKFSIYEGNYEEGERYFYKGYQFSIGTANDAFDMEKTIGVTYYRLNNLEKLAEHSKKAINIRFKENAEGLRILKEAGQYPPSFSGAELEKARQKFGSEISFMEATAWLFWQLGDKDTAKQIYEQTIENYIWDKDRLRANMEKMIGR